MRYEKFVVESQYKSSSATKYIIPVAVHVVHQGGPENISDAQIMSQIKSLNNDYRKIRGTKGYTTGVDTEIEFALATKDPSGNPTNGITRDSSALSDVYYAAADSTFFSQDSLMKTTFGWPPDQYMNVWIVKQIDNDNILGYAFYPPYMAGSIWAGTYSYDGIVIAHWYWGTKGTAFSPWNLGGTGTHEVGHWLGLFHPFEIEEDTLANGCACSNCLTCADRVCDTPPTFDPNYAYPQRRNSCSNDSPDLPDQVRNYMDYADDGHMDMYTEGQKTRMHFFMDNDTFRMKLSTPANHQATGVGEYGPVTAGFTTSWREIDAGATIGFLPHVLNTATSYSWTFPGGTPSTSTLENPVVTYDNAGTYDVTLIVANNVSSDTLSRTNYIKVSNTIATLPFTEDFEGAAFPPLDWRILNPDSGGTDEYTWEAISAAGGFGQSSKSGYLAHIYYRVPDQKDGLVLPAIDLTNMDAAEMAFSIAYEPYDYQFFDSLFYLDTLSVLVSTDLGSTWTEVWRKGGEELATYSSMGGFFIPDNTEWRRDTADLSAAAGSIALVKFESLNKYGGNLFMDDVSVEEVILSVETTIGDTHRLKVFPNPFSSTAEVEINLEGEMGSQSELWVYNTLGELVKVYPMNFNTRLLKINSQDIGTGIYMLELRSASVLLDIERIAIVR